MIKLSNRLEAISSFIDKKDISLDVGCDHALLDIYLSNKYNKNIMHQTFVKVLLIWLEQILKIQM